MYASSLTSQWCRKAFEEKEARLKSFHEGNRTFGPAGERAKKLDVDARRIEAIGERSRRSGRTALVFLVALLLLVLGYGGTIFGLYALSACCAFTLVTAGGGWDAVELSFSELALGSVEGWAMSKQD